MDGDIYFFPQGTVRTDERPRRWSKRVEAGAGEPCLQPLLHRYCCLVLFFLM